MCEGSTEQFQGSIIQCGQDIASSQCKPLFFVTIGGVLQLKDDGGGGGGGGSHVINSEGILSYPTVNVVRKLNLVGRLNKVSMDNTTKQADPDYKRLREGAPNLTYFVRPCIRCEKNYEDPRSVVMILRV